MGIGFQGSGFGFRGFGVGLRLEDLGFRFRGFGERVEGRGLTREVVAVEVRLCAVRPPAHLQGYLAHKKQPSPLGLLWGPRHGHTVGS